MSGEVDKRFDLDVYRTMDERVEMVEHSECPPHVLDIVIEHDVDQTVLEAIYYRPDLTEEQREAVKARLTKTPEQLEEAYQQRMLETKDQAYKVFCSIPWNHVSTNADGSIRMCCQMIHDNDEAPYGTLMKSETEAYTGKDDPKLYRNHPALKRVRSEMLKGIDPEICKLCTQEENNGIGSRRTGSKKRYPSMFNRARELTLKDGTILDTDFPLRYFDLRFGNKCNLKCRSCGPTDSDLWYEDFYKMAELNSAPPTFMYRKHSEMTVVKQDDGTYDVEGIVDWYNGSALWDYITNNLKTIDRYYFTGGEPTINLKHRELLQLIIDKGLSKGVWLEYNTNMAGIPSKVFEQWKQFRQVNIGMSIDGIYEHFEYIRSPGKWSVAERNMRRLDTEPGFNRVHASITCTLGMYNVLHILDMIWWYAEQNWTRLQKWIDIRNLYGPRHLNIQNLPPEAKQFVDRRYKQFINAMHSRWTAESDHHWKRKTEHNLNAILQHMWEVESDPAELAHFKQWTDKMDRVRNESLTDSVPELAELITRSLDAQGRKRSAQLIQAGKK